MKEGEEEGEGQGQINLKGIAIILIVFVVFNSFFILNSPFPYNLIFILFVMAVLIGFCQMLLNTIKRKEKDPY